MCSDREQCGLGSILEEVGDGQSWALKDGQELENRIKASGVGMRDRES